MGKRKKIYQENFQLDLFEDLVTKAEEGDKKSILKLLASSGRGYEISDEEIEEICKLS